MKKNKCHDEDFVFLNDEKLLFEGLQRLCNKKITALFIAEEALTLKTIYYLDLLGKRVPEDISVVSKEISGSIEFLYPPITCIIQPLKKLCLLAADIVLKRTNGRKEPIPRYTYIPYDFVERESVIRI
jgi:LacI family transcriptional regulator